MTEIDDTLTFSNQVESRRFLKLLNDHIVRLKELSFHSFDNRLDDELLCLGDSPFREWVVFQEVFGYLHDCYSHLEVIFDNFQENLD